MSFLRKTHGKNTVSRLDSEIHRLTFLPARYAKERPQNHIQANIILLDGGATVCDDNDRIVSEKENRCTMGRQDGVQRRNGPKTRSQDELFPMESLCMEWSKCLIHTPPLAELFLSDIRVAYKDAEHGELDPIGMTQRLIQESLEGKKEQISPVQHAKSLRRINRWFRLGRQEDAHEYLIALLDAMHDRSIAGMQPKPSRELEYTSFIYQIFGGKIRSQLKCSQCDYESNTYDPFLDLSLEITRAHSVQRALQRFTAGEVLDGQNSYKCPKQNKMVRAIKRMTIEDAPNVLIIQLKRFEFSRSGRKISKHVDFDQTLDLSPFMSYPPKGSATYDLYGILVHEGFSMHSGHYYCFLKGTGGGEWHRFDDSRVHATSARNAMGQSPYILFYTKRSATKPSFVESKGKENIPIEARTQKKKKKKIESDDEGGIKKTEDKIQGANPTKTQSRSKPGKTNLRQIKKSKKMESPKSSSRKRPIMNPAPLTPLARRRLTIGSDRSAILLSHTRLRSGRKQSNKESVISSAANPKVKTPKESHALSTTKHVGENGTLQKKAKKRGREAVEEYKTNKIRMGLDSWNEIDNNLKKERDRNMWKTVVPRNKIDEYDAEYDKGRTKKVKSSKANTHLTSAAYDAVAKQLSKAKSSLKFGIFGKRKKNM